VSGEDATSRNPFARAIAAKYPDDAAVLAALAECEYDAGHDKEAVVAADTAIKRDPSQVNAYVQKGYALFREAEDNKGDDKERAAAYKTARAPFIALNRLENDHPLPLIYFYRSFVEQGEQPPKLAVDGLIRAVELAPFDLGLRMTLGTTLLRLGRSPEARTVLGPVANNPHGGGMSTFAHNLIERMANDPAWKGEDMGEEMPKDSEGEGAEGS
jgi:tetratricopeptide (TPR) repeat protein